MSYWDKSTLKIMFGNICAFSVFLGLNLGLMGWAILEGEYAWLYILGSLAFLAGCCIVSMIRLAFDTINANGSLPFLTEKKV